MPTLNSWNNQVVAANVTLNGGTCDIGTDATSGAINIATGAAARTTTLGNTTGASALNLKYGTADFSLVSASGNVMLAQDTGQVTLPLQPRFSAYRVNNLANVTGDLTTYIIVFDAEDYDIGGNYDTGTGVFTAPVTGNYMFSSAVGNIGLTTSYVESYIGIHNVTQGRDYGFISLNLGHINVPGHHSIIPTTCLMQCTAGDQVYVYCQIGNSAKTVGVRGGANYCNFSGILLS